MTVRDENPIFVACLALSSRALLPMKIVPGLSDRGLYKTTYEILMSENLVWLKNRQGVIFYARYGDTHLFCFKQLGTLWMKTWWRQGEVMYEAQVPRNTWLKGTIVSFHQKGAYWRKICLPYLFNFSTNQLYDLGRTTNCNWIYPAVLCWYPKPSNPTMQKCPQHAVHAFTGNFLHGCRRDREKFCLSQSIDDVNCPP